MFGLTRIRRRLASTLLNKSPSSEHGQVTLSEESLIVVCSASKARCEDDFGNGFLGSRPLSMAENVRTILMAGGEAEFPIDHSSVGSLFYPLPLACVDAIVIGRSIRLFDSNWSRALLVYIAGRLTAGGLFAVPAAPDTGRYGMLEADSLDRIFGSCPVCIEGGYRTYRMTTPLLPTPSIVTWYYANFASLIIKDLSIRLSGIEDFQLFDNELLGKFWRNRDTNSIIDYRKESDSAKRRQQSESSQRNFEKEVHGALGRHSYSVGGIAYKSAVLSAIIRRHLEGRPGRKRYCDMGGGYGLLAAELLLDEEITLDEAVVVDLNTINLLLGAEVYIGNLRHLKDRLSFWLGSFTSYEFDQNFEVISLIGSLLYANPAERKSILERAWNALSPGGILIVHENIKAPSYTADHEIMFTVSEIDGLLEKYGEIERWSSVRIERLTKEQAAEKSIFRVVRKPHTEQPSRISIAANRNCERLFSLFDSAKASGISFSGIQALDAAVENAQAMLFLKHDVHGMNLDSLRGFAEREKRHGITGTYFFMAPEHPLTRPHYSFEAQVRSMAEIQEMGHDIGLHLDPYFLISQNGKPLAEIILDIKVRFRKSGIDLKLANMHGHTGHKHLDQNGYGTSFDLFEEICRQPDWPALASVPQESADLIRSHRTSLKKLGFDFWGDMPLWSTRHGFVTTNFISDNQLQKTGKLEVLIHAETTGAYALTEKQPPGSRNRGKTKKLISVQTFPKPQVVVLTKAGHLDFFGEDVQVLFGSGSQQLLPAQMLVHPEFYCE